MRIIVPVDLTDATLTNSNVAEEEDSQWATSTAYAVDDIRMVSTVVTNIHKRYQCLIAHTSDGTVAGSPDKNPLDGSNNPYWVELGSTNRWKMFNTSYAAQTENASSIEVTIDPGQLVNGLFLGNLDALNVEVTTTDPIEGEVFSRTVSTRDDPQFTGWFGYYYDQYNPKTDLVFTDLPPYPDATLTVKINYSGGTAKCGALVFGRLRTIGSTDWGASVNIFNYSVKTTDEFGNVTITDRAYSNRGEFDVTVSTNYVAALKNILANLRNTACVWVGSGDYASTIMWGYYRDFDIVLSEYDISDLSISIEGLT